MSHPPVSKREITAWSLYDFANSGYTTVVLTAVFNAYFVSTVAGGAVWATFAWTATLSVSYFFVMLAGPLVGAWADANASKKRGLAWATVGCVVSTALLATVSPGALVWAMALIVVSNVCYALGENLNAGFLPELAKGNNIAKVSAYGWSIGYMGGLSALAASLGLITYLRRTNADPQTFVGAAMISVAIIYTLAAIPFFLGVRERAVPTGERINAGASFSQLRRSIASLNDYPELLRFMRCAVFYQAGVSVVITVAAVYAEAVLGFKTEDTITMLIVVNVSAAIGAFAFGWLQDKFGHRETLFAVLIIWMFGIAVLVFKTDKTGFWIAANLAGIGMGACQSGGRALVGYLSPPDRLAEFYGVWGFYTRFSAILGPLTYGAITWIAEGNHRLAMLSTGVFFVIALVILVGVDVAAGRKRVAPLK
jgi:MFS transporter, UMF1 family